MLMMIEMMMMVVLLMMITTLVLYEIAVYDDNFDDKNDNDVDDKFGGRCDIDVMALIFFISIVFDSSFGPTYQLTDGRTQLLTEMQGLT